MRNIEGFCDNPPLLPTTKKLFRQEAVEESLKLIKPGMVVPTFNPGTWEAETGGSLLQREFQDSQSYTERPCLENKKQLLIHTPAP